MMKWIVEYVEGIIKWGRGELFNEFRCFYRVGHVLKISGEKSEWFAGEVGTKQLCYYLVPFSFLGVLWKVLAGVLGGGVKLGKE